MHHRNNTNYHLGRMTNSIGWLLPSLCGVLLSCLPGEALQLQSWRFDQSRNRLEFSTDQEIRPRVQLIPNPTRLVVDLPGIVLDQPTVNQTLGTIYRAVRLGQLDNQTARIVVEVDSGYTLDPQQVKVHGSSPTNWSVELPTPQRLEAGTTTDPFTAPYPETTDNGQSEPITIPSSEEQPLVNPTISDSPSSQPAPAQPTLLGQQQNSPDPTESPVLVAQRGPTINDVLVTGDGLFLPTQGDSPKIKVKRSRNQKEIQIEIAGSTIVPQLAKSFSPGYHGIQELAFNQVSQSPAIAKLTLKVDKKSPNWQASVSRFGGIALLPQGNPSSARPSSTISLLAPNRSQSVEVAQANRLATIKRLDVGGSQLLIESDQPIRYATRWVGSGYEIKINDAQLAPGLREPRLGLGSPLSRVRIAQNRDRSISILVFAAPGVRVARLQKVNPQALVLSLYRPGQQSIPPIVQNPSPSFPGSSPSPTDLPQPRGRAVVVIDPGHGGPDPGAIGIGGLRETNVVLEISLEVSRILQQQGVTVYLTRTDERDVDLPPRVALAERVNATLFVSIHANAISMSRPDVNGLETFYAPGSTLGARLAQTIQNTILRNLQMGDRGVRSARFYVIRQTSMPAALVETGFLTGERDIILLRNPAWRKQMANAIAQGILNYLSGRYN
ncbi:MAG: AMIN domain-containing protein [Acaryochloridaceae cyanobacterium SU_2_1]|nr:AMIN domain-containing protein [Acaryochloridaceae cyanobacterium SU_2_1]